MTTNETRQGAVYDVGAALAVYWPDTHPCHTTPEHGPWLVLLPEGSVEWTAELREGARLLDHLPGFGPVVPAAARFREMTVDLGARLETALADVAAARRERDEMRQQRDDEVEELETQRADLVAEVERLQQHSRDLVRLADAVNRALGVTPFTSVDGLIKALASRPAVPADAEEKFFNAITDINAQHHHPSAVLYAKACAALVRSWMAPASGSDTAAPAETGGAE